MCKRYGIDNSHRELHGALLDAEILADVYLLMTGGQASLLDEGDQQDGGLERAIVRLPAERPRLKVISCSDDELAAHRQRLAKIGKASGGLCLWQE